MNSARIIFLLTLVTSIISMRIVEASPGGDTIWVGSMWFLTNSNAGKAVAELPYDTVLTDPSIIEGLVWDDEKRITYYDQKCYYPSLSASDGFVHVAHTNLIGDHTEAFYQTSPNSGASWNDSIQLSYSDGIHGASMVDVECFDSLAYVAWARGGPSMYYRDVRIRRSSDYGASWSDPVVITEDIWADYAPFWIRISVNGDTLFCTYTRIYSDGCFQRFKLSADKGDSWSDERIVSPCAEGTPASIDHVEGFVSVALEWGLGVYHYVSTDHGSSWYEGVRLSDTLGYEAQWPAMARDDMGGVYVTWFDYTGSPHTTTGYILLRRSTDWGETWEPIVSLSTLPTGRESSVYADSSGVYVVWTDERQGSPDTDVYFRMSTDMGATWCPEVRLDNAPNPSNQPSVYLDGGLIHVLWRDQRNMEWALYHRVGGFYLPGDADNSDGVDIDDAVLLIFYIFQGGAPPQPYWAGDPNCDGVVDIDDVVYLVCYIFIGGPEPC